MTSFLLKRIYSQSLHTKVLSKSVFALQNRTKKEPPSIPSYFILQFLFVSCSMSKYRDIQLFCSKCSVLRFCSHTTARSLLHFISRNISNDSVTGSPSPHVSKLFPQDIIGFFFAFNLSIICNIFPFLL